MGSKIQWLIRYLQVVQSIEDCDNLTMKSVVLPFAGKKKHFKKISDKKNLIITFEMIRHIAIVLDLFYIVYTKKK